MGTRGHSLPPAIRMRYESIVTTMLIGGASRRDIMQYARGGEEPNGKYREPWAVSDQAIDNYIKKAKKRLSDEINANINEEVGLALAQYNVLYRKALAADDIKTAMLVIKAKSELLGLNAPKRVDAKSDGNITIVFDEKYDEIL